MAVSPFVRLGGRSVLNAQLGCTRAQGITAPEGSYEFAGTVPIYLLLQATCNPAMRVRKPRQVWNYLNCVNVFRSFIVAS